MTYCNIETEEIRRFSQEKSFSELELWFQELIGEYVRWAEYLYFHEQKRDETLRALDFPYPYRAGQRDLAVSVYRALSQEGIFSSRRLQESARLFPPCTRP